MTTQILNGLGLWLYMLFIQPIISLIVMVGQLVGAIIGVMILGCFLLLMASPFILALFVLLKLGVL